MLLEESSDNRISAKPYWHKLLHFYHPGESIGQWNTRSDVISLNFFLHPQGNTDPELELQATLEAILEPVGEDPDQHVPVPLHRPNEMADVGYGVSSA